MLVEDFGIATEDLLVVLERPASARIAFVLIHVVIGHDVIEAAFHRQIEPRLLENLITATDTGADSQPDVAEPVVFSRRIDVGVPAPTQEVIVLAVDAAVVHGIETLALAAIDYAAHGEAILLAPRHGFGVQMQQAGVGVALGEGAAEIDVAGPGDADAGHFR